MKKILFISNSYFNLYNFRKPIIEAMKTNKHLKIYLVAQNDKFSNKFENSNFILFKINFFDRSYNLFKNMSSFIELFFFLKKNKFDHIFSFTIKPNFFCSIILFFFKFNLTITISGLGEIFLNKKKIINKILIRLYLRSIENSKNIFFHNIDDLKFLTDLNPRIKNKAKVVNGSGIDLNQFDYHPIKNNKIITYLLPARIIKEKGILEFINAANKLDKEFPQKIKFKIAGEKYIDSKFNFFFEEAIKNSCVEYLGFVNDLKSLMIECSCIVLPSYREGLSRTLIEAIAIGRPIITTNVPGCRNLYNNNGYLIKSRDYIDLYDALKKFYLLSFEEKLIFNINSRKHSRLFSTSFVVDRYINLI